MDVAPHTEVIHTIVALAAISIASLVGSISFALGKRLEAALPYLVSIAAGTLLATAVTHLLPEAIDHIKSVRKTTALVLVGLLGSFALERTLTVVFRRLRAPNSAPAGADLHFHHGHEHEASSGRPLVANILLSGAVHSFIDGVSIAVAFAVSHHIGMATTVAVLLHEVPHHVADVTVLIYSGLSRGRAVLLNLLATSGCALGGVLFLLSGLHSASFTYAMLPIAAANFLYIGLSILIPELHKEPNDRRAAYQMVSLAGSAALMTALSFWVPG